MKPNKLYALPLAGLLALGAGPATDVAKDAYTHFSNQKGIEQRVDIPRKNGLENLLGNGSAYAQDVTNLDGKIDTTTYWTPEKIREIINDEKLTLIYWRWEGIGNNRVGDRFFRDVLRDYGSKFNRIILVEGGKYPINRMYDIKEVLNEFNKSEQKSNHGSPMYSITGFGKEVRIRGPPIETEYEQMYNDMYKKGFEEFLPNFVAKK